MKRKPELTLSERFVSRIEEFRSSADRRAFFSAFSAEAGLGHFTYFGVFPRWGEGQKHALITTYAPEWESHYFEKKYDQLDPVLLQAMSGVIPFDWDRIKEDEPVIRNFFGDAGEFGIKRYGFSIPVRGPSGDLALFSVTAPASKREWDAFKPHILPDLIYLANLVHSEVSDEVRGAASEGEVRLSAREKEVLSWSARGKTSWETARILDLSERTVDFYLRNAIFKLGAANKTQAVSKAISQGDLTMPFRIDL